ncbi:MAG: hypothetical protein JNK65_09055, partial [Deltaproteobacteria bacterium]|nr:hypothetical protein [Deltaproteobacteria bacterium]
KDKNEDLEFILHQLSILDLFYHGASKIFDDFYQGKKVDIDLLRKVIFED